TAHGSLMVASYTPISIVLAPGSPVRRAGRLSCVLYPPGQSHPATNNCRAHLSVVVPDSGFRRGSATTTPLSGSDSTGIDFRFTSSGSHAWCHYTTRHVGKYAAFVLDNQVLSDPMIQSPICSGQEELIANTKLKARMIAAYINYGPLPARLGGRWQISTRSSATGDAGSVPPAAQRLANRLGIHEPAIVGDQLGGKGGPWTVWFPHPAPIWLKPVTPGVSNKAFRDRVEFRGKALFVGPRGAAGEFHYFNATLFRGPDTYHGAPLTRDRAVHLALAWLHRAGVPVPLGSRHVALRGHTTNIGGTGLCCFKSLAVVYWGKKASFSWNFPISARAIVYVADRGVVVETDMGSPAAGAENSAYPCKGNTRDAQGVAIGHWCFGYPQAARGVIFTQIGGHDGLITRPDYAAERVAGSVDTPRRSAPRRIKLTIRGALYRWTVGKTTYTITVVPAFPGLIGSTWYVQSVRVQGRS
ncbi:MAG TPA: hypothetical protein VFA78_07705, partial [Chloroflexota bacterium]|nr:hypothetical protein [Chloroflexota bacterium]